MKAQTIYERKGLAAFAEDTGLFIDVLHGEPGVRSARYAGEHGNSKENILKVLEKMGNSLNRKAYFKTVVTLLLNHKVHQFTGECHGRIALMEHGEDGFGYDPIFIPEGYEMTFAQMPSTLKNNISHRKKAFDSFFNFLNNLS